MKRVLNPVLLISLSFFLQACGAVPAPSSGSGGEQEGFMQKYSERFSVDGIKQTREQEYAQKLKELNRRNPVQDAQRAVAADNYYFLSYKTGRGAYVKIPGLTEQQLQSTRCGLRSLDGMGDSIYGKNHQQYRNAIRRYASQFNKKMFSFCR